MNQQASALLSRSRRVPASIAIHSGPLSTLQNSIRFVATVIGCLITSTAAFFALYYFLSAPPMQWFYDVAPQAGNSSIYVPGGGFAGFWFHLGYLQSLEENIKNYDFYCFSSGCLGVMAVLMNQSFDHVSGLAFAAKDAMITGNITRFEVVEHFLDESIPSDMEDEELVEILSHLKILVTTSKDGFQVLEPKSRAELMEYLIKTTWVPFLTGWGILQDDKDSYWDGGFSRRLHPECEYRLDLPMIWETVIHTFNPDLTRSQVNDLWAAGKTFDYGLPKTSLPMFPQPHHISGV